MKLKKQLLIPLSGVMLMGTTAQAQSFAYGERDLLLVFAKNGQPNLEVDIGSINLYKSGTSFGVPHLNGSQLTTAYDSINSLNWGVIGAVRPGQGDSQYAQNTLWLTSPRTDANTPTDAYQRRSNSTQSQVSSTVAGIGGNGSVNGAKPWSAGTPLDPNSNASTFVIIPSSDPNSYTMLAGQTGNLNGKFGQGTIENLTSSAFTTSGGVSKSDFYELPPGSGVGTFLGSFTLNPNGSMSFTAVPEPGEWALMTTGLCFLWLVLKRKPKTATALNH